MAPGSGLWSRPSMAPTILVVDDNQELLSLLKQLFEEAGYNVQAANKGRPALDMAQSSPPALAILDMLLPDMMGTQLAEQLRGGQKDLPLMFITGVFKGGRQANEVRQKFAGAGYFEKPFEAKKLLEAVAKLVPVEKPQIPVPEETFEVELDVDVEEDQPQDPMELTGRIKISGGNLHAELTGEKLTAAAMNKGEAQGMRPPTSPAQARAATPPPPPPAEGHSRRGDFTDRLPSLITAFYQAKETGELGVQRGKVKKIIYFEKGQPVFALSNLAADRFGQFLVRVGKIKQEQLTDAVAVATASKRRTGDVLVERGLLKETERLYYVGQQVKAIIYSLFGWEDGEYVMSFKDRLSTEAIKLDVHPANLIMRGVKKLYKPERLRRLLSPEDRFMPSPQPAYQLHEVELEKWEAEFLVKVDGTRNVAELVAMANRPEHVVHGFLYSLLALGVVERSPQ